MMGFIYGMIAFSILVIIFATYKAVTIQSEYNSGVKTSFSDGRLYVKKRGSVWKKFVKIKKAENVHLGYEAQKLHYGSATVGGVTSGGFYTTGGYNKVIATENSGKCFLEFAGNAAIMDKMIRYIDLSDALYEEAKYSPIAKYLNHTARRIEVFEQVQRTKEETDALVSHAIDLATGKALIGGMSLDDKRGYPTREKCRLILDWICDE